MSAKPTQPNPLTRRADVPGVHESIELLIEDMDTAAPKWGIGIEETLDKLSMMAGADPLAMAQVDALRLSMGMLVTAVVDASEGVEEYTSEANRRLRRLQEGTRAAHHALQLTLKGEDARPIPLSGHIEADGRVSLLNDSWPSRSVGDKGDQLATEEVKTGRTLSPWLTLSYAGVAWFEGRARFDGGGTSGERPATYEEFELEWRHDAEADLWHVRGEARGGMIDQRPMESAVMFHLDGAATRVDCMGIDRPGHLTDVDQVHVASCVVDNGKLVALRITGPDRLDDRETQAVEAEARRVFGGSILIGPWTRDADDPAGDLVARVELVADHYTPPLSHEQKIAQYMQEAVRSEIAALKKQVRRLKGQVAKFKRASRELPR